jgi:hypothetical protein
MAIIITKEQAHSMWKDCITDRQKSEIACCFHGASREMMWASKELMASQAKLWRELIRSGDVQCLPGNNLDRADKNGRMWFMLCVQVMEGQVNPDPIALLEFGFMVIGCCYFFKTKSNRDSIFQFINQK